jgi:hypothetical protein
VEEEGAEEAGAAEAGGEETGELRSFRRGLGRGVACCVRGKSWTQQPMIEQKRELSGLGRKVGRLGILHRPVRPSKVNCFCLQIWV